MALDFPEPVGADQGDRLARVDAETHILQHRLPGSIAEGHVPELNRPVRRRRQIHRVRPILDIHGDVEHLRDAVAEAMARCMTLYCRVSERIGSKKR